MSVTGFNRRREAQKKAAEEAARLKEQSQVDLDEMTYQELRALAKEREIEGFYQMNTEELRKALQSEEPETNPNGEGANKSEGEEDDQGEPKEGENQKEGE